MWAHSLKSTMRRSIDLPVRSLRDVLGGIFILTVLLLMLPSSAFAAAFTSSSASVGTQRNVDQAGVSVVRLIVTYTANSPATASPLPSAPGSLQCTGLGVLVSSSSDSTGNKVWVLTDGSLVNPNKVTCNTGKPTVPASAKLTNIEVLVSNEYTNNAPAASSIEKLTVESGDVTCDNTAACDQGLALFSFSSTALQPYIDLTQTTSASATVQGIGLLNQALTAPPNVTQAQQYLTPQVVPLAGVNVEAGTPLVDGNGSLVGMHLLNGPQATLTTIKNLMTTADATVNPANTLHDNWDKGIAAFYATPHNFTAAQAAFQKAADANPQFKAAATFKALATTKSGSSGNAGNGTSVNNPSSSAGAKTSTLFGLPTIWVISIVALILLVVILLLVSQLIRRRNLAGFNKDEASAASRAELEAQRIAVIEAQQRQARQSAPVAPAPIGMPGMNAINGQMPASAPLPVMGAVPQAPVQMSPARDLACPRCGQPVPAGASSCPNCHTRLSLTDSQLHYRVNPQQVGAGTDQETTLPLSPQPQPQFPLPSASLYAQPTAPYPMENQPTQHMSPDFGRNGQDETEKTLPFKIRQVGNNNLGLVVGTQTNPGIKRKHKPNEDSVFAAQGAGMFNSAPQPFGLFVVADGMGGHANGQDASRLAIQTIIDYMLPRLKQGEDLDRDALTQLLVEGVQHANQAVFQHNLEQRADMGTTMTSALVVGATAIVANVGDSRTYLYREPEGLKKVTNDHSVVASLVEAGIIKPDDIYTHPKRNQIYRSLGEKPAVEVDSFVVDLLPGDKLLLCSDGLWDMVRDPNIQQVLRNAAPSPDQTGEALIQAALNGGGEDNVSVIVVYVTDTNQVTGISGLKLLTKPETVNMPQI